jgi:CRISPR/Cas system-associated protein endoribonuclease Cas2
MYGKIDLTERFPDGTIVVSDFKTGSSKTSGMIEKIDDENRLSGMMRQLAMYSYLIRGSESKDVTESRLVFLEEDQGNKNALYRTHVTGEQIELLIRDITDYQNLLTSGEWINRPCHTKGFGKNSECEYCARVNKILGK